MSGVERMRRNHQPWLVRDGVGPWVEATWFFLRRSVRLPRSSLGRLGLLFCLKRLPGAVRISWAAKSFDVLVPVGGRGA